MSEPLVSIIFPCSSCGSYSAGYGTCSTSGCSGIGAEAKMVPISQLKVLLGKLI